MSQEWKPPAAEDDVQVPLGASGGGEETPMEEYSPPKVCINSSTVALIAAFAAGLVVLYFLGLQNKPKTASADEMARSQVNEQRIQDIINNKMHQVQIEGVMSDGERLRAILDAYFGNKPVVQDLTANPFQHAVKAEPPATQTVGPVGPIVTTQPVDADLKAASLEIDKLKVQMIVFGPSSTAMIDNQIVTVGSHFKYWTVAEIQSDQVIMSFRDIKVPLLLKSGNKPK